MTSEIKNARIVVSPCSKDVRITIWSKDHVLQYPRDPEPSCEELAGRTFEVLDFLGKPLFVNAQPAMGALISRAAFLVLVTQTKLGLAAGSGNPAAERLFQGLDAGILGVAEWYPTPKDALELFSSSKRGRRGPRSEATVLRDWAKLSKGAVLYTGPRNKRHYLGLPGVVEVEFEGVELEWDPEDLMRWLDQRPEPEAKHRGDFAFALTKRWLESAGCDELASVFPAFEELPLLYDGGILPDNTLDLCLGRLLSGIGDPSTERAVLSDLCAHLADRIERSGTDDRRKDELGGQMPPANRLPLFATDLIEIARRWSESHHGHLRVPAPIDLSRVEVIRPLGSCTVHGVLQQAGSQARLVTVEARTYSVHELGFDEAFPGDIVLLLQDDFWRLSGEWREVLRTLRQHAAEVLRQSPGFITLKLTGPGGDDAVRPGEDPCQKRLLFAPIVLAMIGACSGLQVDSPICAVGEVHSRVTVVNEDGCYRSVVLRRGDGSELLLAACRKLLGKGALLIGPKPRSADRDEREELDAISREESGLCDGGEGRVITVDAVRMAAIRTGLLPETPSWRPPYPWAHRHGAPEVREYAAETLVSADEVIHGLAFSATGEELAFLAGARLFVFDSNGRAVRGSDARAEFCDTVCVRFTSKGILLWGPGLVILVDTSSLQPIWRWTEWSYRWGVRYETEFGGSEPGRSRCAITPDEERVVVYHGSGSVGEELIHVLQLRDGNELARVRLDYRSTRHPCVPTLGVCDSSILGVNGDGVFRLRHDLTGLSEGPPLSSNEDIPSKWGIALHAEPRAWSDPKRLREGLLFSWGTPVCQVVNSKGDRMVVLPRRTSRPEGRRGEFEVVLLVVKGDDDDFTYTPWIRGVDEPGARDLFTAASDNGKYIAVRYRHSTTMVLDLEAWRTRAVRGHADTLAVGPTGNVALASRRSVTIITPTTPWAPFAEIDARQAGALSDDDDY